MRKLLYIIGVCFFASSSLFAQGIHFEEMTFDEALSKAKREDKLIFMDCYTEWCGPCKVMSRNVFTKKKVGDFFNANLINLKMDMEKGEGITLAKQYGVKAYPTMLLIRPDGTVQHTLVGSLDVLTLLERVQAGMKVTPPDNRSWSSVLYLILGTGAFGMMVIFLFRRKKRSAPQH